MDALYQLVVAGGCGGVAGVVVLEVVVAGSVGEYVLRHTGCGRGINAGPFVFMLPSFVIMVVVVGGSVAVGLLRSHFCLGPAIMFAGVCAAIALISLSASAGVYLAMLECFRKCAASAGLPW